jgi:hypothetical protein
MDRDVLRAAPPRYPAWYTAKDTLLATAEVLRDGGMTYPEFMGACAWAWMQFESGA